MAQALRRFGSRVTVIERNDALAHREDRDVSEALRELFDDEGIEVLTATPVARVEGRSGESVRLHATHGMIEGSDLLVASGRTPNTDGIGLETAGIERDDRGFIKVDERLRTTAAGVWAVGDCAGSPHFTHIADDDVRVIRDNLAGGPWEQHSDMFGPSNFDFAFSLYGLPPGPPPSNTVAECGEWSTTLLPLPDGANATTVYASKSFGAAESWLVGGYDTARNSSAAVFVFDGSAWHQGPSLPIAVNHPGAAVIVWIVNSLLAAVERRFAED